MSRPPKCPYVKPAYHRMMEKRGWTVEDTLLHWKDRRDYVMRELSGRPYPDKTTHRFKLDNPFLPPEAFQLLMSWARRKH